MRHSRGCKTAGRTGAPASLGQPALRCRWRNGMKKRDNAEVRVVAWHGPEAVICLGQWSAKRSLYRVDVPRATCSLARSHRARRDGRRHLRGRPAHGPSHSAGIRRVSGDEGKCHRRCGQDASIAEHSPVGGARASGSERPLRPKENQQSPIEELLGVGLHTELRLTDYLLGFARFGEYWLTTVSIDFHQIEAAPGAGRALAAGEGCARCHRRLHRSGSLPRGGPLSGFSGPALALALRRRHLTRVRSGPQSSRTRTPSSPRCCARRTC